MSQEIINYGSAPNDGSGDPLRTAFIKTDNNFDQIWAAGPVGSNIQISDNVIRSINTNGNVVINTNGVGVVKAGSHFYPLANNAYNLGSNTERFRGLYVGIGGIDTTGNIAAGNLVVLNQVEFSGDLTVAGNLTVEGDTIQIGNIVTDTKTIQLSNTAQTAAAANLSGITVGVNDNIATLLYNASSNAWTTNIGVAVTGNVSGNYILGNAAFMTGLPATYGNSNVVALLAGLGSNSIVTTGNVSAGNLSISAAGNTWTIAGQFITGPGGAYWHSHPEQQVSEFASAPGEFVSIISRDANNVTQAELYLGNTYAEIFVENGINHRWRFNESGVLEASGDIVPVTPGGAGANIGSAVDPWTNAWFSGTITSGNIIPLTSNTYSLGNATNQWSDLYVSNATIYMNNVPISLTAGNVLTVNGADVVTTSDGEANIGNLTIYSATIAIAPGAPDTDVYISPSGESWAFLQVPTNDTANVTNTRLHNDAGNVEIAAGDFSNGGPGYEWIFDKTGNLVTPGNLVIGNAPGSGSSILQYDSALQVVGEGPNATIVMGWAANTNTPDSIAVVGFNTPYPNGAANVTIAVGNNATVVNYWNFDNTGNLNLPSQGNIVGTTPNNSGSLQWVGNSSGDGYGYTTMILRPDDTVSSDQSIVIDPTAPNHIHIRAGGVQDDSAASLFLGGESSHFQVSAGLNPTVYISANNNTWTFNTDGELSAPGNITTTSDVTANSFIGDGSQLTGLPASYTDANVVSLLSSFGSNTIVTTGNITAGIVWANNNGNGTNFRMGDDLWLGDVNVSDTMSLRGQQNAANAYLLFGNADTTSTLGRSGSGPLTWKGAFTVTGNATVGNIFTDGYYYANGTPFTPGSNYGNSNVATFLAAFGSNTISTTGNITAGNFTGNITITGNVTGTSSNVELVAGSYEWTFDNAGNLTLPGNTFAVNYANGTQVALGGGGSSYGDSNVVTLLSSFGSNTISTTGNITVGNIRVTGNSTTGVNSLLAGVTNTPLSNTVAAFSANVNSYTQATLQNKSTGADATADWILTADNGSDTVNYGDFGIINSGYDVNTPTNSLGNIVYAADTYIYAQGNTSNTAQSGGNLVIGTTTPTKSVKIFAGGANNNSLIANISNTGVAITGTLTTTGNITTGNIIGSAANVTITANAFVTTFDTTGTATFPGAMKLAVYANTTVRDAAIPSPVPGMMIYVTGTGMQVRGATQWNTISGSGT